MKQTTSLTTRLLGNLLLGQIVVIVALWAVTSVLGASGLSGAFGYSFDDYYSYYRIRDYVVRSIVRDPDGTLRLDPNAALIEERTRRRALQYAVFEKLEDAPLRGSSPELARAIQGLTSVRIRGGDFLLPGAADEKIPGSIWRWNTPFGPLLIAVSGFTFYWSDPFYALFNDSVSLSINLAAIFAVSGAVSWLAVRRGLAPLRHAAEAADRIDLDTLGQGMPIDGAPVEAQPLIDSINGALARLDASAARMRRYTAGAAHELRTPLAILEAHIEDPLDRNYKTRLKRDARRMRVVVDQLLIMARVNEGQAPSDQEIDLVKAVRAIVADCAPLAHRSGREIEFVALSPSETLTGNRQALDCVAANLIDNALRAEPEGGCVVVEVGPGPLLNVIDHGPGVAPSEREKIFEPFWRKDETTLGSGLGLSIAKELVEKLGGCIRVEDTPGGGATFRVHFRVE